jgi:YspA, cpYpsA-related SLOG family/Possible lysine decarboxylase
VKVIIAGGRGYIFAAHDAKRLDALRDRLPITEVVCGCASGADTEGRKWAERAGLPVKEFRPDWDRHGRAAGPIRNGEMARYADALVAFPGGFGTSDMVRQAKAAGLRVFDWRDEPFLLKEFRYST